MLNRVTAFVSRHPWRVILVWLLLGALAAAYAQSRQSDVITNDTSSFLPNKYESVRATKLGQREFGVAKGATTVTALVKRADGTPLTGGDRRQIAALSAAMTHWRPDWSTVHPVGGSSQKKVKPSAHQRETRVVSALASPPRDRGRFELVSLQFKGNDSDPVVQGAFFQFRADTQQQFRAHGLSAGFTSGVATSADTGKANASTAHLEQALLFAAIVLLNLLFFRGILAAAVPLMAVVLVAGTAGGLIVLSAKLFGYHFDINTPQLITTVLIGIGTDYYLFMAFRFRERLRAGDQRKPAAALAGGQVAGVIASAALAVAAAFATLGLAQFGQFRVLGPAVAISVLVMLVAGVTLFPAVLAATGPKMFWPSKSWRRARGDGPATRIGRLVARRPALVATSTVALLAVLAVGAIGVRMNYDLGNGAPHTESTRVADEINRSLPRGVTDPQHVYITSAARLDPRELEPMRTALAKVSGVGQVSEPVLSRDGHAADIELALNYDSTTKRAMNTASGPLRQAAHHNAPRGSEALVGGTAAIYSDIADSISHDLKLIFPLAAMLILIILVALLRSAVAPVYLLVAVALEFAATLGAAALLFQHGLGQPGVAFTMPLVLFLFVVALGTDYNILMSSRLREEERKGTPVREAVAEAFSHAAPAIGAAGLILASSFGTLAIYHDQGTKQMGFAMASGILIASFVVSSLLVPAIAALVGRRAWWPGIRGRLARIPSTSAETPAPAPAPHG
jgi:putative drug exporter of the RND superfamily